ncbi:g_PROTEIN_RECEP_F1_2 domain-containing protein [Trichonephila clavata]|uniref:G_PROTEIN_RECEP_F1_2 domain-containing protein n=1 Tax=Trichonephila clavata TaxID=2740835 RepID=A0A8X6LGA5_TRICU|nr:g_PROTEIN_RECEP_F1_2 domain-containing protein [Trichonephila clavata]
MERRFLPRRIVPDSNILEGYSPTFLKAVVQINLIIQMQLRTPGVGKAANVLVGKALGTNGTTSNQSLGSVCHPAQTTEAIVLFTIAALGMGANMFLMLLIVFKRPLRRWSQGLLFHQGLVDCGRASLLLLLGIGVLFCQRLPKCNIIETAFLLLVTVSTVNMLTSVINDASLLPDQDFQQPPQQPSPHHHHYHHQNPLHPNQDVTASSTVSLDSPQCIIFGLFIIWFASFTINLGPTLLSGALTSSRDTAGHVDACPMVYGPVGHYVLNVLWVTVNVMCVALTGVHLRKLYRDLTRSNLEAVRIAGLVTTMISVRSDPHDSSCNESQQIQSYIHRLEQEGIRRVKSFAIILAAYILFWGPLFTLTLIQPGRPGYAITYEITLHVAFVHAFVNPTLLLMLHRDLRNVAADFPCCGSSWGSPNECSGVNGVARSHAPVSDMARACRLNRGYITVYSATAQYEDASLPVVPPPPPPRSSASSPASYRHLHQDGHHHHVSTMTSDHLLQPPATEDEDTASSVDPEGPIQSYQILEWEAQPPDYATSSKHASNGDMSTMLMH